MTRAGPKPPRSIRQKLNTIVLVTTFFALLVAGMALVAFDLRNQINTLERDLITQADIVGLASAPALVFDDARVGRENLSVLRARQNVAAAALFNAQGQLFASFTAAGTDGTPLPRRAPPPGAQLDFEWVLVARPITANREVIGTIYLQAHHELVARVLEYLGALCLIFLSSLGAALLLSNRLQTRLTAPILAISDVAQQVMQRQDFSIRAEKLSDDEVGSLVDVFNAMLAELGKRADTLEQANQALRESDERYQLAVRGSSAGLWDWDMVSGAAFYSPRFKALLGFADDEFPNRSDTILTVLHADDRDMVRTAFRDHLKDGKAYQIECRLRLKSGELRWFFVAGQVLKDAAGRAYRMAGSMIDITERKQAEQTLQEASRAKDEFLATLAHELRNPLAPIRTGLEILKKDTANGPPSQRARSIIERQLVHMIRLIDDLLDISRISSGKIRLEMQRVQLRTVIDTALETTRPAIEAGRHSLAVDLPEDEIWMDADLTRLAQAVGNLLNNAAKYTPPGGQLGLQVRREGTRAVIQVTDNGVGVPAEMLERIFQLFAQVGRTIDRAQGGLGIGLSLVRSLVELHGGSVSAQSDGPGRGSTFTLRIPCEPAGATAPAARASGDARVVAPAPMRVLVADDNVDAADTMTAVLEMAGHEVRTVYSGGAALAAAPGFAPDIMLLDIGMPGLNGYQVAQQLRADARFDATLL
ncbi:MAG: ATP-binding protein, partial [Ramlibacter sp.]